jgi:hypothetical protein
MKTKDNVTKEMLEELGYKRGEDTTQVPYGSFGKKMKRQPNCIIRVSGSKEFKKELIYIPTIDKEGTITVQLTISGTPRSYSYSGECVIPYIEDLLIHEYVELNRIKGHK